MFDQGWTIFRIRGIPVKLHFTLLLFLPYVAFAVSREFVFLAAANGVPPSEMGMPPLAWGFVLAVGLFVAILLHELAHSMVAIKHGVRIRSITLMMLGGVSQMEGDIAPEREAWMAFAGPLASVVIAALAYLVYRFVPLSPAPAIAVLIFAGTNAMLAAFNLLPAFPMDGGRVLRGLLVRSLGRERATVIATWIGKGMAILFALFALVTFNVLLLLIAGFIYLGASAEQNHLVARDMLRHLPVEDFMTDRLGEAGYHEPVGEVARRLLRFDLVGARVLRDEPPPAGSEGPVYHHAAGIVTAWDLAAAAARGAANEPVGAAARTDLPAVHPGEDASEKLEPLLSGAAPAVVVVNAADEIIGLITPAELKRAAALSSLAARR